jgi:hypothetical protein
MTAVICIIREMFKPVPEIPVYSTHNVLTYVEYRAVSGVFQNINPLPHIHPASLSSLRTKGGGYTSPGGGGGGSIFWKTPDIGLASYSIISLRLYLTKEENAVAISLPSSLPLTKPIFSTSLLSLLILLLSLLQVEFSAYVS